MDVIGTISVASSALSSLKNMLGHDYFEMSEDGIYQVLLIASKYKPTNDVEGFYREFRDSGMVNKIFTEDKFGFWKNRTKPYITKIWMQYDNILGVNNAMHTQNVPFDSTSTFKVGGGGVNFSSFLPILVFGIGLFLILKK